VFDSEKKYLLQRRNLGAAVEEGDHEDYITTETLGNSEAQTGKTYDKTLGRTETIRWQNNQYTDLADYHPKQKQEIKNKIKFIRSNKDSWRKAHLGQTRF